MLTIGAVMSNGDLLSGELINELTSFIINKFAEEGLTRDEAVYVLDNAKELVGSRSIVQKVD